MAEEKASADEGTLLITRVFDAPRELVFRAWTEPERLARWWGPRGFIVPFCTIDLRPGGAIHFMMRSPAGQEIWCKGIYREIVEPERIVCTSSFSDPEGNLVPPTAYGLGADWPAETLVTVTFEDDAGKTRLTLRQTGTPPGAQREDTRAGWNQSLDRLADYLR